MRLIIVFLPPRSGAPSGLIEHGGRRALRVFFLFANEKKVRARRPKDVFLLSGEGAICPIITEIK